MNIKYWYEFRGLDDVLNRVEILCSGNTSPKEIQGANSPFSIKYIDSKKLNPVQGSQADLRLISKTVFEFIDLHTDDMQGYVVKFYRAGLLYWIGYLDSELYEENLTDTPPYAVGFSGADFNIWERLKFRDENEKAYRDIVPLIVHLKRCFDKLGLPFQKLYVGCSTVPHGVALSADETSLHVMYMMSQNFYDEEGEPMTCREVVESILQPFGLMMVQRDGSVCIYDYNTIKNGGVMKCYNFNTLAYIGDTAVAVTLSDLSVVGIISQAASLGFEEMINNVTITSSLYADKNIFDESIKLQTLSEKKDNGVDEGKYKVEYYNKDINVENLNGREFAVYINKDSNDTLIAGILPYKTTTNTPQSEFRVRTKKEYLIGNSNYYLNVKLQAYANTRNNPFDTDEKVPGDTSRAKAIYLHCNLYTVDENGKKMAYYDNRGAISFGWISCGDTETMESGQLVLMFVNQDIASGEILNSWYTNSDLLTTSYIGGGFNYRILEKNYAKGLNIPLGGILGAINGYLVFEITDACPVDHPQGLGYPYTGVKNVFINDITLSIKDKDKADVITDDYEFKSYVNKKVSADFEEITLKCISANEERVPIGKANILKKVADHYELQLSYTRAGQTDILERLLMCTIHSNYSTKNKRISVDVNMFENPTLRFCTYSNVLQSDGLYITGSLLDFYNAKVKLSAVEFSSDVAKLSNISYD